MRLLERKTSGDICLTADILTELLPPYAILSHTWGDDSDEVSYTDLVGGLGKHKAGYQKIQFCVEQAAKDGLRYSWVDTCCINKPNHTELSEAIISMFHWYKGATKCYVYLSDVSWSGNDQDRTPPAWEQDVRNSRWFKRGWTLQELLAPTSVEFFSRDRNPLGNKKSLQMLINEITGIPVSALQGRRLSDFTIVDRMSWAAKRDTKRKEDKAYSLLGIFGLSMPVLYGEGGDRAFRRLRDEIHKASQGRSFALSVGLRVQHETVPVPSLPRKIVDDPFSDLVDVGMDWVSWLRRQLKKDPTYLRKVHGNLLENLFKPTSDIVKWRIQGGLIIWERDDQLHQDAAWNSLWGLSTPILTNFAATLSLGHVIARPGPDLHGSGLLLKTMGGQLLGSVFSGQTNKAYMLQVSNEQVTTSQHPQPIRLRFPDPVPSMQEKDRWRDERDKVRLGCKMTVFRNDDKFIWRISDSYKHKRVQQVDITSKAPELFDGIKDVGICFFGRGCAAYTGLEVEVV